MKNLYPLFALLILLSACQPEEDFQPNNPVHDYLKEVTLGQEFTTSPKVVRKWNQDVRVYLTGNAPIYLQEELNLILGELNELIGQIRLIQVQDSLDANFYIHLGSGEDYLRLDPEAADYIDDNWGLFAVQWNKSCEILKGTMYVDIERAKNPAAQRHLLREEFTQARGLFNDSPRYPQSIFQQAWTTTTRYSPIDRQVIQLLYSVKVVPCATETDLDRVLNP